MYFLTHVMLTDQSQPLKKVYFRISSKIFMIFKETYFTHKNSTHCSIIFLVTLILLANIYKSSIRTLTQI